MSLICLNRCDLFSRMPAANVSSRCDSVPKPKITKDERLVQEQMLAMLEWASEHSGWHKIGDIKATKKAAELLARRGVIEVWPQTNMYRLKANK